ncbi:MAG: tRNA (N6-isopentenyl adenosine(37)-C2)-methylthiotransferase MiaB [Candidatus Cloacimonadaceae bacterium]
MKFYLETYGCQMNEADSELVTALLKNAGHEPVSDIDQADVIIFNTCSVRQHAENRVLGRISCELKRKLNKPELKIGIIGCMAQRVGEELVRENIGLDFAVGVDQYENLPQLIAKRENIALTSCKEAELYENLNPDFTGNFCDYVTIMRGCNNFCSYCIVPYVRGRERSRAVKDIENDIKLASVKGIKDITLLGQNVNSYHWQDYNFPKLLKHLNKCEGFSRLRFLTSHPKDLSDELIEVMAEGGKICEHIHLPLQSGDNDVLAQMNRHYTIEDYLILIDKLRKNIPNLAITTDLIVGFPGETDKQFENTIMAVQTIGFDYAFCFKYSNRSGTRAAEMTNQIDEQTRLLRLQQLIEVQREQTKKKFQVQIGKTVEVLVEGKSKRGGNQVSGKTRDFKICAFEGGENIIGQIVRVRVTGATAGTLIGVMI